MQKQSNEPMGKAEAKWLLNIRNQLGWITNDRKTILNTFSPETLRQISRQFPAQSIKEFALHRKSKMLCLRPREEPDYTSI